MKGLSHFHGCRGNTLSVAFSDTFPSRGRLCAPPGIEAGLIPPPAGPVEKVYKSILAALMNLRRHLPDSPDNPDNPEIPDSKRLLNKTFKGIRQ